MNWRSVFIVYCKELKDALRDRRTLFSTIVIPTIIMPVMVFGFGKVVTRVLSQAREEVPTIAIVGGADSPGVVARLRADERMRVVEAGENWRQAISDKRVRAAVEFPAGFETGLKAGAAGPVTIYHYKGEIKSGFGSDELERFLHELREQNVVDRLAALSLPARFTQPFETRFSNVAPPEKVGGALLGGFVPYIIIMLCFSGAMYPAVDVTAGEKERGTMETLLCSPVGRTEIVLGKFLLVLTGSLSAMAFTLISLGVSAVFAGILAFGGTSGLSAAEVAARAGAAEMTMPMIDPFGLLGVLAMVLPVAVLFSAVIFTVALFAKSHKEAQSYIAPMVFLVIMPAVIGLLPGIELDGKLALVPIVNLSLVCKEMLSGVWNWHYIALIFASSCLYAAGALTLAVKMFQRESVIFRS